MKQRKEININPYNLAILFTGLSFVDDRAIPFAVFFILWSLIIKKVL